MMKTAWILIFLMLAVLIPQGLGTPDEEGFSHYINISLDHDDVDAALTDFPVLIHLSSSCGINSFDASPIFDEIGDQYNYTAYTDADGSRLFFEIDSWSSTDSEAWIWVKVPSISADDDTVITFWFEKFVDGSAYNSPEDVWDSNFKLVSHMNDDPDTSHIADSTSNGNDGTKKGCLPEGTYIKTVDGFKDIVDVEVGDKVFTYTENGLVTQNVKRVIESGVKQLYELKTKNREIRASGNHPFLVLRYNGQERKSGYNAEESHPFSYLENQYSLEWVALEDLTVKDVIVVYSGGLEQEGEPFVSENMAQLLGCYLGDGSNTVRRNRIRGGQIVLHLHDVDLIEQYSEILTEEGINHTKNSKIVTICGNEDYYKLTELGFKGKAHTKNIPQWVYNLPKEHKEAFIQGLIDSDGYSIKYGFGIHLCNKHLVEEIRNLCIDLGYRVGKVLPKYSEGGIVNGRKIKGGIGWILSFYPDSQKDHSEIRFGYEGQKKRINIQLPKGFEFQTINSIEELGYEETYDLEIENSHNFIADGIVVHNSNEPVEASGKIGKAQDFDGTDDYIEISHDTSLAPVPNGSISFWLHYVTQPADGFILDKGLNGAPSGLYGVVLRSGGGSPYIQFYINTDAGVKGGNVVGTIANQSQHFVIVWSTTTNNIKIYIDGGIVNSQSLDGSTPVDSNTYPLRIATRGDSLTSYYHGIADEIEIIADDVSPAWVGASYQTQIDDFCSYGSISIYIPDLPSRGEFLAAGVVLALILVPLMIFVIFAARRRR